MGTVVTVRQGVITIPHELRGDPRYQDGAQLRIEPIGGEDLPEGEARGDWRALEGTLAECGGDATEDKRREREFELTHDEQKFGIARPTW